jgi:hypothetical protein
VIITYRTGGEPEHRVAISVMHIAYLTPKGNFTYVHLTNGEKFLVHGAFEDSRDELKAILENEND